MFKVGQWVIAIPEKVKDHSAYDQFAGLKGKIIEITQFNCAYVEFPNGIGEGMSFHRLERVLTKLEKALK